MLKNYLTVALRHLRRHRGYALINVAGLAVGMAACLLIGLYVRDEVSYDRFHERADRIYRVTFGLEDYAATSPPLGPALEADYPGLVEHAVRFWPIQNPATVRRGDDAFVEQRISFADPDVFDVFSFPLRDGDPATALTAPKTMVISASMAEKYFGDDEALGQTLQFWGEDYEVTGVMDDLPSTTHFPLDALVSFASLPFPPTMLENWTWAGFYTYVLLPESASPAQLQTALESFVARHTDEPLLTPQLQALPGIHLHSHLQKEIEPGGSVGVVYLLATIALLVLVIAAINFINLSTARGAERAREIGMRKALGARHGQLVGQFLGESVLLSLAAAGVAAGLVVLALPAFRAFTGNDLPLGAPGGTVALLAGLALVVGLAAGSYPAFFMARLRPVGTLKGSGSVSVSGQSLRTGLVVFQFAVSITLLIAATVVYRQLDYLQTRSLGFDEEQVVVTEAGNYEVFREALRGAPEIERVAAAYDVPGHRFQFLPVHTEAMPADSTRELRWLGVGYGFLETLGVDLAAGRSFSEAYATDAEQAVVLNEAAVRALGWSEPLGQRIDLYAFSGDGSTFEVAMEGAVVGVTDDFNYASLHGPVEPLIMTLASGEDINLAVVRLRDGQTRAALARIEAAWHTANPGDPFDATFLDARLDGQYRAEQRLSRVFGGFTVLAVFIACLGLFGLAALTTQQRTQELGVRKVLGASVGGLVLLIVRDFARLVVLAACVAAPLAYAGLDRWLGRFAFHIDLGPGVFLMAGGLALLVAVLTVGTLALRAATADPVQSLRYE